MTEKNIFAYYKPFLSLHISNFDLFFMWELHLSRPRKKSPPLKVELLSTPLFKNLVGGSAPGPPPPTESGAATHYLSNIIYCEMTPFNVM